MPASTPPSPSFMQGCFCPRFCCTMLAVHHEETIDVYKRQGIPHGNGDVVQGRVRVLDGVFCFLDAHLMQAVQKALTEVLLKFAGKGRNAHAEFLRQRGQRQAGIAEVPTRSVRKYCLSTWRTTPDGSTRKFSSRWAAHNRRCTPCLLYTSGKADYPPAARH